MSSRQNIERLGLNLQERHLISSLVRKILSRYDLIQDSDSTRLRYQFFKELILPEGSVSPWNAICQKSGMDDS